VVQITILAQMEKKQRRMRNFPRDEHTLEELLVEQKERARRYRENKKQQAIQQSSSDCQLMLYNTFNLMNEQLLVFESNKILPLYSPPVLISQQIMISSMTHFSSPNEFTRTIRHDTHLDSMIASTPFTLTFSPSIQTITQFKQIISKSVMPLSKLIPTLLVAQMKMPPPLPAPTVFTTSSVLKPRVSQTTTVSTSLPQIKIPSTITEIPPSQIPSVPIISTPFIDSSSIISVATVTLETDKIDTLSSETIKIACRIPLHPGAVKCWEEYDRTYPTNIIVTERDTVTDLWTTLGAVRQIAKHQPNNVPKQLADKIFRVMSKVEDEGLLTEH
jgi:hypothetical protein